jgi:hypothetical protein
LPCSIPAYSSPTTGCKKCCFIYRKEGFYHGSEKSFRKNVNELKELVGLISDTLNYLSDNKSHWLISNDTIIFDSKEKLSEFGILLSKIEDNNEYINQKEITKQDETL